MMHGAASAVSRCPIRRAHRVIGLVLGVMLVLPGCFYLDMAAEDLSDQPIAFLYWDRNAAKKRAAIMEKAAELPKLPPNRLDPAREEEGEIRAYLRSEHSLLLQSKLAEFPGQLTLIWPRTGETERIEAAPPGSLPLAWSPDRTRLLFSSKHRGEKEQLYEYHLARKDLRPITTGPDEHPRGDYGADGRVVVERLRRIAKLGNSVMSVHLLGSGERLGPSLARGVPPGTLRITPDGTTVVYEQVLLHPHRSGAATRESMIATQRLGKESHEALLVNGREPTLTPDGQWIVFASASSAGYRLRRMRPDGTARVPISPGGTEERMPSVSPDGEYVAFIRMEAGRSTLAVRRLDGKGERTLLSKGWSEFPVW